jgi:hypothetical protein
MPRSVDQTKTSAVSNLAEHPLPDRKRKRHTKTFPIKKEATAWLANTTVEIRLGTHTPAHRSPTVLDQRRAARRIERDAGRPVWRRRSPG